ncbi:MAG: tRNA (adenosine(37)-N6)-dimethylallyltransferase MiaA [Bacteroidota bacterium]
MTQAHKKYLVSIVGPTAVGKTSMAIQLAKHYKTVVLSADSRQFFKEISIGTAKPSEQELNEVTHYFIGHKSVADNYSAGDFEREALDLLAQLFKVHDVVILVGGSGLYIKALWEGLDEMPEVDMVLRNELIASYEKEGITYLQAQLLQLDGEKYKQIDTQNPQRLMRAIEIAKQMTPELIAKNANNKAGRSFEVIKIALNMDRELLYQQINKRVDAMMEQGLLAECKSMVDYQNNYALKTVGYTEIFEFFEGRHSLEKAIELIKQHTRNYAKRQITWFKREQDIVWFHPTDFVPVCDFINQKIA